MDIRKWPKAIGKTASMSEFLQQPAESVDVLVSQSILWENIIQGEMLADDLLSQVHQSLRPGGVWYFTEMLPQDFPAHWLYRFLPSAWQWVKTNTWTVYTFYNHLLSAGFKVEIKRYAFYQPISTMTAQNLLQTYPGFANSLTDNAVKHAIERLNAVNNQTDMLPSEFTIIEGWAQKQ